MSLAITALAPRLNAEVFAKHSFDDIDPPQLGKPVTIAGHEATAFFQSPQRAMEWCGTVPKHFPIPRPKGGSDDIGWCGTVPRPLPGPVPPTPPQPWLDLANAAQSFR